MSAERQTRLTGREPWVVAGLQGSTVWARKWGDKDWWWPIFDVELDCGLIRIDVCGMPEIWDLSDCAQLRIENETPIDQDDFYEIPALLAHEVLEVAS